MLLRVVSFKYATGTLGSDACAVPVLSPEEAAQLDPSGSARPAPHPHLSRTPALPQGGSNLRTLLQPGTHMEEVLLETGLSGGDIRQLALDGAFGEQTMHKTISKYKL